MYTTNCRYLSSKGYPITVVTCNNKEEISESFKNLVPTLASSVAGLPTISLKMIDNGIARGVEWLSVSN